MREEDGRGKGNKEKDMNTLISRRSRMLLISTIDSTDSVRIVNFSSLKKRKNKKNRPKRCL
jgi:hypothetical protein